MLIYIILFSLVLLFFTDVATTVAFVVGAITSIACGWVGMKIAVKTNVKTTRECWRDLRSGFDVAIQGGCVMGLSLVSIGVLALFALIRAFNVEANDTAEAMFEAIAGYG